MLYKKCIVTVSGNKAKLDEDIHLYRLDKNIDLYFTITNNKYKFNKDDANSNIVTLVNAAYSQVRLYKDEKLKYTFPIQPTERGDAILTISEDLIDEYIETGDYDLQISLLDRYKKSMVSMPIIYGQIHIHEPLGSEHAITGKALAGLSKLVEGGEIKNAFDENGNYVREIHIDGEVITAELLNKFEKAFEKIFKDKITAVKVNEQTYNPVNGVIELPDYTKNSDFTTEQTSTSFIIRFKGVIIANIPLQLQHSSSDDVIYTITNILTNCTNNNPATSAYKNSSYIATITANSGYEIKSITVTMGGTDITSSAVSNSTVTIAKVTGNIVITAVAEIISYPIINTLIKCSTNNDARRTEHNSTYEATITADDNYKMSFITVTMGGTNIDSSYITPITEDVPDVPVVPDNPGTEKPEDPSSPIIDGLSKMTYGKGIDQTTGEMTTNAECWATVNPVSVTSGKSYTITLDATYLWVINCDNDGNVVIPFLTTGTNEKPQTFTFTASSSKIKFGCYDPSKQLTYCTISESSAPSQPIVPGQPDMPNEPDPASDVFSILAVNPVTIDENYATGELTPDRGVGVTNLTVSRGQAFNITYCTNSPATKHELSRDNGSTYADITGSVATTGTSAYRYQHSAVSNVNSYNMAIRVTDADGHTSVRRFVITFS